VGTKPHRQFSRCVSASSRAHTLKGQCHAVDRFPSLCCHAGTTKVLLKLTPKLPLNTLRLIYTWDPSVFKECDDARVFVNADTAGETPCIVRSRRLHVARLSYVATNHCMYAVSTTPQESSSATVHCVRKRNPSVGLTPRLTSSYNMQPTTRNPEHAMMCNVQHTSVQGQNAQHTARNNVQRIHVYGNKYRYNMPTTV
jgi:hypothetical protein